MLAILRDRKVGFGDDFTFLKRQKINCLLPDHLKGADLDADPARYQTYELAETRQRFVTFNEGYFHHLFFALAPLLAIPVYQQTRSHESIYVTARARASDSPATGSAGTGSCAGRGRCSARGGFTGTLTGCCGTKART